MSFKSDIAAWKVKVLKASDAVFRGTCLTIFGSIIRRTPIRIGRLAGNWQTELNTIPTGIVDGTGPGQSMAGAVRVMGRAKITDSAYLINNLPYAKAIEDGGSTKAPAGMVKVTIAEFQRVVEENARKNKI